MKIVPMVCGSSFKNKGVQTMLDYVMELLPSPMDKDVIYGTDPDTGDEIAIHPDEKEPFVALAFKIATESICWSSLLHQSIFWRIGVRFVCVQYSF